MNQNSGALLSVKEAELSSYFPRMEQLRIRFMSETAAFASEWYKATAKEYVVKNDDLVSKMSDEQLKSMKTKINVLVSNTEKTVKQELDNPSCWWHLRPHSHDNLNQYLLVDDRYPIIIDQAVRQILGFLGVILEEFKFNVSTNGNAVSYEEYWYIRPPNKNAVIPYYPHPLKWSTSMQETIQKYNALYLQAIALFKEIELLKEQTEKERALSRWDSL
jgi:hypothetical protein